MKGGESERDKTTALLIYPKELEELSSKSIGNTKAG